ncbi:MAG: hypothetical protein GY700_08830, partial [Propionibacteriaceae bacterium]|nr:hypothetical protein [Propionibacteriaceae bacterium]
GANVIGYNLAGFYENDISSAQYARMPAVDCSLWSDTSLSFQRWLGVEGSKYDHAAIEVSTDGAAWHTVWSNPLMDFEEDRWRLRTYDISEIADGHHDVHIRWALGPTDDSMAWVGWNIDDVLVTGFPSDPTVSLPVAAPALTAASDSGISASDAMTSVNSSLTFSVGNTVSGATITLYVDGLPSATAIGNGAEVIVTTAESPLPDGAHVVHATQTQPGLDESVPSPAANVTVDT